MTEQSQQSNQIKIKENNQNVPFLQRFEDGVCQKFAIFTILMFVVPFGIFLTFRKTVDNAILVVICLVCSFVIMVLYVIMAFNEHFESDDIIIKEAQEAKKEKVIETDNDNEKKKSD